MYSNGSRLSLEFAQKLQDVGLSSVSISLISINGELHDKLRQAPGSHFRALKACRAVVGSGLRLGIQFIVSRHNYCELPQVIQSAIELGAYSLELNYPENDIKTKHLLMCKQEILEWREQILPESLAVLEQYGNASSENIISLSGLYSRHSEIVDFSVGTYWSSVNEVSFCDKPLTFAMVYPNGDVLPCNAVEYTHEPIVGNVLLQPLDEIWQGSSFEEFRLLRIPWCQYCPMTLHARLELATPRAKDQLYQEHCASSV
jgi:radical SAM protein with 4Fe4S-binding SPASM domain